MWEATDGYKRWIGLALAVIGAVIILLEQWPITPASLAAALRELISPATLAGMGIGVGSVGVAHAQYKSDQADNTKRGAALLSLVATLAVVGGLIAVVPVQLAAPRLVLAVVDDTVVAVGSFTMPATDGRPPADSVRVRLLGGLMPAVRTWVPAPGWGMTTPFQLRAPLGERPLIATPPTTWDVFVELVVFWPDALPTKVVSPTTVVTQPAAGPRNGAVFDSVTVTRVP